MQCLAGLYLPPRLPQGGVGGWRLRRMPLSSAPTTHRRPCPHRGAASMQVLERMAHAAIAARQRTVRALSCFEEAVMLCDVRAFAWPQLYVNDQWCRVTGEQGGVQGVCVAVCLCAQADARPRAPPTPSLCATCRPQRAHLPAHRVLASNEPAGRKCQQADGTRGR